MSDKRAEFLKIRTYEEFDRRREEFKEMEWDGELNGHFHTFFKDIPDGRDGNGLIIEAFPLEYGQN